MGRKNKKSRKTKPHSTEKPNPMTESSSSHNLQSDTCRQDTKDPIQTDSDLLSKDKMVCDDKFKATENKKTNNSETQKKISLNNSSSSEMLFDLKLKMKEESQEDKGKHNKIIKNNCRDNYIHYLCQICKNIIDPKEECKKCRMISYCSTEHRRQHWPTHADLCGAIQNLCQTSGKAHILDRTSCDNNAEKFKWHCYNLMLDCQRRVQRRLEEWEIELFLYPNVCETCFNYNREQLIYCKNCHHTSFCKPQHQKTNHNDYCDSLVAYRKIMQYQHKNGLVKTYFPENFAGVDGKIGNDMNSTLETVTNEMSDLEYLQLTEIATEPLTAMYSLKLFDEKYNNALQEVLTVHIIGAETYFELNMLNKWEIFFLHCNTKIKTLYIVFIGPEMNLNNQETLNDIKLCERCKKQNRRIYFEFFDKTLYHDYSKSRNYKTPNLICAFNAGLYRETGFNEKDTWPETIRAMFKTNNIPILVTAYTSVEIFKDLKRIEAIQKNCEVIKTPSKNYYSSLKPNLNFISYEEIPVIYKNYYLTLLK